MLSSFSLGRYLVRAVGSVRMSTALPSSPTMLLPPAVGCGLLRFVRTSARRPPSVLPLPVDPPAASASPLPSVLVPPSVFPLPSSSPSPPSPPPKKASASRPAPPPKLSSSQSPRSPRSSPSNHIRLSKRCSELQVCSRREADALLSTSSKSLKRLFVRGTDVTASGPGLKVSPKETDIKIVDRGALASSSSRQLSAASDATASTFDVWSSRCRETILLHKPVGYVSSQPEVISRNNVEVYKYDPAITLLTQESYHTPASTSERDKQPNNLERLLGKSRDFSKGLAVAGRLDLESSGLLVFTRDGVLAKKLLEGGVEKEYLVRVEPLSPGASPPSSSRASSLGSVAGGFTERKVKNGRRPDISLLANAGGKFLKGEKRPLAPVVACKWVNESQLTITITDGMKRQVRRMCEELMGCKVTELRRVRIGPIMIGKLGVGQWRFLSKREGAGLLGLGSKGVGGQ